MTAKKVGMRLKKIRVGKKLSQAALAKRVGLSREYVNKIEAGRYDPPLSTLEALAKVLKVSVARLVS